MKSIYYTSSRTVVRVLRETRKNRQYSQEFMAGKIGISQEAYSRLELHETTPSIEQILSIAHLLELSPQELMTERREKQ